MRSRLPLTLLLLAALALPLRAGEEAALGLEDAVRSFATTQDPAERLAAALAVRRTAKGDATRVGDLLADAWSWPADVETGEVTWQRTSEDGVSHTVFFYAPEAYTPEKAWPLMIWLHGGISRDQDGGGAGGVQMFKDEAEAKGFLILSPSTQNGAHWWTPTGAAYVREALLDAKRRYHVDPDRVAVMGFSDGGSGAFHLLAHDPSPYAVFVPMMGNPLVTRIYGGPTWSANVGSRPVYAVNGGRDQLYPSAEMKPFMDALIEAGARMTWIDEPESGHEPSFLERRWDEIYRFWMDHPRETLPETILWAASAPGHHGRFAWVEITELDEGAAADPGLEAPAEMALPDMTPSPRLGIRLDVEAGGPGLAILEVQEGTPAEEAGFQAGDRIVRLGEEELDASDVRAAVMQLRAYLDGLEDEDGLFVLRRGEEEIEVRTRPKVIESDRRERERSAELGYDVPPGIVRAEVTGNEIALRTKGIRGLRLHLAEPLVDLDQELVVTINGKEAWRGIPKRDVAYLLAQAAEGGADGPRYEAFLDL